jgi:hypothetical protein
MKGAKNGITIYRLLRHTKEIQSYEYELGENMERNTPLIRNSLNSVTNKSISNMFRGKFDIGSIYR